MTDKLRAAAQAALEALKCAAQGDASDCEDAITLLRAALAKQVQEQEPVAYLYTYHGKVAWGDRLEFPGCRWQGPGYNHIPNNWRETPLYTTPPRREWQSLTDEEIEAAWKSCDPKRLLPSFAAAIEAALKEKNNGVG